jgi:hypothetical protein
MNILEKVKSLVGVKPNEHKDLNFEDPNQFEDYGAIVDITEKKEVESE